MLNRLINMENAIGKHRRSKRLEPWRNKNEQLQAITKMAKQEALFAAADQVKVSNQNEESVLRPSTKDMQSHHHKYLTKHLLSSSALDVVRDRQYTIQFKHGHRGTLDDARLAILVVYNGKFATWDS
mmetsp:Transcript_38817/g.82824  ORF Transcript_38817/g.82824 Transcript_38817/m.82824 type:complete len:127 (+) Transcript_38817:1423-1803(+)